MNSGTSTNVSSQLMKPVFLVCNNDRDDNLGDQIISKCLSDLLAEFGSVQILGKPKPYHHYPACEFDLSKSLRKRAMASLVGKRFYRVMPPGGWGTIRLPELASQRVPSAERNSFRSAIRNGIKSRVGLRDILLGASLEIDENNPALDEYFWVGVRDSGSLQSLASRKSVRGTYFPDLCFFEGVLNQSQPDPGSVGISFRSSVPEKECQISLPQISTTLRDATICSQGKPICYSQVLEDGPAAAFLAETLGAPNCIPQLDLSTYRAFYSELESVVSNRLHCLLLGAVYGALPIALTYSKHRKLVDLYRTLGWEQLLVLMDTDSNPSQQLKIIARDRDSLMSMVKETCLAQREIGIKAIQHELSLVSEYANGNS